MRPDCHASKSWRRRVHSEHRTEDLDIGAGTPGVTVGPRRSLRPVDNLGESRQAARQHVVPITQLIEVTIAFSSLRECAVDVEAEKQSCLRETRRRQRAKDQIARGLALDYAAQ